MTVETKPTNWTVIVWAGVTDVVLGVALVLAGLTGVITEDGTTFALFGGLLTLAGIGVVVWARTKQNEATRLVGRQD